MALHLNGSPPGSTHGQPMAVRLQAKNGFGVRRGACQGPRALSVTGIGTLCDPREGNRHRCGYDVIITWIARGGGRRYLSALSITLTMRSICAAASKSRRSRRRTVAGPRVRVVGRGLIDCSASGGDERAGSAAPPGRFA